jgi:predicted ABC-type ATPase
MAAKKRRKPRCIIIAGPNGAGKTTFARKYLPNVAGLVHFINADLIAGGISPLQPELAAVTAGRLVLRELDRLTENGTGIAATCTESRRGSSATGRPRRSSCGRITKIQTRLD